MDEETETKLGIKWAEQLELTRVEKRWEQIWNSREQSLYEQGVSLRKRNIVRFIIGPAITSEDFSGHYVVADSWVALVINGKKVFKGAITERKSTWVFFIFSFHLRTCTQTKTFFVVMVDICHPIIAFTHWIVRMSINSLEQLSMSLYSSSEDLRTANVTLLGEWWKLYPSC